MQEILYRRLETVAAVSNTRHAGYHSTERELVNLGESAHTIVCAYEVAPGNAAYPYHYHVSSEETFYILSGEGVLRTPQGERPVRPGDVFFFPKGAAGAHKLTNTSHHEPLCYLDFDTATGDADICIYPDSGKVGAYSAQEGGIFRAADGVDYYDGE